MNSGMLQNKYCVVTGAAVGIGRAIALELANNGANVAVLFNRHEKEAKQVCKLIQKLGRSTVDLKCNVADRSAVQETVQKILGVFPHIDILVNNAGIVKDKLIYNMSDEEINSVIDVNLKGSIYFIQALYHHFMRNKAGRIINIASASAITCPVGQANYTASKAGVIAVTKTTARELARYNVTCNAVAPGFINTSMTENIPQERKEIEWNKIPLQREGRPEEIASVVSFLASDIAGYITGTVIPVDGGISM